VERDSQGDQTDTRNKIAHGLYRLTPIKKIATSGINLFSRPVAMGVDTTGGKFNVFSHRLKRK